jgi:hypothetical protein
MAAVEDGEPVDHRARSDRRITRLSHEASLVARAVAGDVDHPPVGLDGVLGKQRKGEIDRCADRGPADKRPRRRGHRGDEGAGIVLVTDHRPVDHHPLLAIARPLDVSKRDRAVGAGRDGIEELLALDRVPIAAPLKRELLVVDAAGNVRGKHDRGVDRDRRARRARPRRLVDNELKHDSDAKRQVDPQAAAHQSLLRPPQRKHRAAKGGPEGARAQSLRIEE